MHALRLFLAIDVPNSARERIIEIQNRFKPLNLDATWVKPANIHLTLKFLGDTDPVLIPGIKNSMSAIANAAPAFQARLGNIGVFPNLSRPRVLWVGLENREGHLDRLKKQVEKAMTALGFPPDDKASIHHLTFGRIKSTKGKERLKKEMESKAQITQKPFAVSSVQLIQSQLTPQGSVYTVLEDFLFNR